MNRIVVTDCGNCISCHIDFSTYYCECRFPQIINNKIVLLKKELSWGENEKIPIPDWCPKLDESNIRWKVQEIKPYEDTLN